MKLIEMSNIVDKVKCSIKKSESTLYILTDSNGDNLSYCKSIKRINEKNNYLKDVEIINIFDNSEFESFSKKDFQAKAPNEIKDAKVFIMDSLVEDPFVKTFTDKFGPICYSEVIKTCNLLTPTPDSIIDTIKFLKGENLKGEKVLIINRSPLIGRPTINKLLDINATVICAHTGTNKSDLEKYMSEVSIIITASGKPKSFKLNSNHKDDLIIIDAGINVVDGKVTGDWDYDTLDDNLFITPNPGGIGKLTTYELFKNLTGEN